MITAIVLSIVIHAQMTVPWIGGFVPTAAPAARYTPLVLLTKEPLVLRTGTAFVVTH